MEETRTLAEDGNAGATPVAPSAADAAHGWPLLEDVLYRAVSETVLRAAVDELVPQIKDRLAAEFGFEPIVHEVRMVDATHTLTELTHEVFPRALFFVANNVPLYLYGPAGSGKNVLAAQIARALGLDFHTMSCVTEEYKFAGFMDIHGQYRESEFYKAFTKGGVFFLDELDASNPDVLVGLNAAISNGCFTFPTGMLTAHKDFRVIAAGNTLGTGADAIYTGRSQLDAATLNRFAILPVPYDRRIDLAMAEGDEELAAFAREYRRAAAGCGIPTVCSYRNIAMIKAAEARIPLDEALLFCLTKEMNADDLTIIAAQFPPDMQRNRYFRALRAVRPLT